MKRQLTFSLAIALFAACLSFFLFLMYVMLPAVNIAASFVYVCMYSPLRLLGSCVALSLLWSLLSKAGDGDTC